MVLRASIPVRISEDIRKRLDAISDQCGLSSSELIRRATIEFLEKIESKGEINIPIRTVNIRTEGQTSILGGGDINITNNGDGGNVAGPKRPRRKTRRKTN